MADIQHGEQKVFQGQQKWVWGFSTEGLDIHTGQNQWHWILTATYPNGQLFRVWTSRGNLEFQGNTYIGIGVHSLSVSGMYDSRGNQDRRTVVQLNGIPQQYQAQLLNKPPVVRVELRIVYSTDGGLNWEAVPRALKGKMSRASFFDNDKYQFEIITPIGDVDRGNPRLWSHDFQQTIHDGDLGFQHMELLADGEEYKWPPL